MSIGAKVGEFSIYRQNPATGRQRKEAGEIFDLLRRLAKTVPFDDVAFCVPDPPDFVFKIEGRDIGAELTDIDPASFPSGGHRTRRDFNKWEADVPNDGQPHVFTEWANYTLGESLGAFRDGLEKKRLGAQGWQTRFRERWLLMRIGDGGPFAELLGGEQEITPGMEEEVANRFAKATHALYTICQRAQPFDRVLVFYTTGIKNVWCNLLTFSAGSENRYNLPVPCEEILKRGAVASDDFLTWKWRRESIRTITPIPLNKLHEYFKAQKRTDDIC